MIVLEICVVLFIVGCIYSVGIRFLQGILIRKLYFFNYFEIVRHNCKKDKKNYLRLQKRKLKPEEIYTQRQGIMAVILMFLNWIRGPALPSQWAIKSMMKRYKKKKEAGQGKKERQTDRKREEEKEK